MSKKNVEQGDEQFATVENALGKTEQFIENNKKILGYVIFGIVALVLIVMGYNKYIAKPNELKAFNSMFRAEQYFEVDSFAVALNGDGVNPGFLDIIDDYGRTKSGNLARYYAGICYLQLAKNDSKISAKEYYQNAIDNLEDFSSDDKLIMPMAIGAIGDAYDELGKSDKAAKQYEKAAEFSENDFTSPMFLMKAGMIYAATGNHEQALKMFEKIKTDFYTSSEGREIKKYIAREKTLLGK